MHQCIHRRPLYVGHYTQWKSSKHCTHCFGIVLQYISGDLVLETIVLKNQWLIVLDLFDMMSDRIRIVYFVRTYNYLRIIFFFFLLYRVYRVILSRRYRWLIRSKERTLTRIERTRNDDERFEENDFTGLVFSRQSNSEVISLWQR